MLQGLSGNRFCQRLLFQYSVMFVSRSRRRLCISHSTIFGIVRCTSRAYRSFRYFSLYRGALNRNGVLVLAGAGALISYPSAICLEWHHNLVCSKSHFCLNISRYMEHCMALNFFREAKFLSKSLHQNSGL